MRSLLLRRFSFCLLLCIGIPSVCLALEIGKAAVNSAPQSPIFTDAADANTQSAASAYESFNGDNGNSADSQTAGVKHAISLEPDSIVVHATSQCGTVQGT